LQKYYMSGTRKRQSRPKAALHDSHPEHLLRNIGPQVAWAAFRNVELPSRSAMQRSVIVR
jgi:hypothetical protein